jgi:hypothetical protein
MANDPVTLNPELSKWLDARQSALKIVKTTITPSGQTLDWIPIESQDPAGKIASPPPNTSMPVRAEDPEKPVMAASFELDDPNVERGPAGTVPVVRPDLSQLTRTIAVKDHLNKSGSLRANKNRRNIAPTDPNPAGYYHGTDGQYVKCYGCDLYLNVWDPVINNPPGTGVDHSILQVWLQNYDKPKTQSVEGGWTVDQSLNGDTFPHIFTYYTTNGYVPDGDNLGGYNQVHKGWQQYSSPSTTGTVMFPGIRLTGVSALDGAQVDISMKFQLFRESTTGPFNWWIAVNGIWMGYYPGSLFNGGIANNAEWVAFGGEVYSSLPNPALTKDQMGSGWQAQAGFKKAAYLRNLRNQSDLNGTMVNNNGTPSSDTATGSGANPYDIQDFMNSGGSWGSYLYVGGPMP